VISISPQARVKFEEERRRQAKPDLGQQVSFLYGCGGAGFRVTFTDSPVPYYTLEQIEGIRIYLDAESRDTLQGAVFDWEDGPSAGFMLRHPDAALVEFC